MCLVEAARRRWQQNSGGRIASKKAALPGPQSPATPDQQPYCKE